MSRINLAQGDLWDWYNQGHRVVVTTNIGWDPETFRNNMGAGMALQAQMRFRELPLWYGRLCSTLGRETPVVAYRADPRIVLFPVKPLLDARDPERSWDQAGDAAIIYTSLLQLRAFSGKIALSYPGCGNGGLDPQRIGKLVENVLGQDPDPGRFTLVTFQGPAGSKGPAGF